jgi:hypothetical protein
MGKNGGRENLNEGRNEGGIEVKKNERKDG